MQESERWTKKDGTGYHDEMRHETPCIIILQIEGLVGMSEGYIG